MEMEMEMEMKILLSAAWTLGGLPYLRYLTLLVILFLRGPTSSDLNERTREPLLYLWLQLGRGKC